MKQFTAALLAAAVAVAYTATPAKADPKKVLFFSKSSGFEHDVIKKKGDEPSFVETQLKELGDKNNIEFTCTKDGTIFTPEKLAQFDAFFFYTTGDLTTPGTDGKPPMSKEGKAAFLDAIRNGKGFIGSHCASDTFHSPTQGPGYQNDGDKADDYIKMIGGEFIIHGAQQRTHLIVADPKFPGLSAVPSDFGPLEEWYSLKNFAPDLHVLLVQDTKGMEGRMYQRPPYPSTWAHLYGRGRVFYTNMGHREDVWKNPMFQQILVGALNWTLGNAEADTTPNIDKVTPQASVLPGK